MEERRYQVFISSTYEDLIDIRQKATEEILKLGHIPIGMEMFNADDEEQWKQIAKCIDESDYYIVIVAQRYGSITRGGISYTEKEYNYAKKKGIPIIRFLVGKNASIKAKFIEDDPEKLIKLKNFKKELQKAKYVVYWDDIGEFATKLVQGLVHMTKDKPQVGWVRGDWLVPSKKIEELGLKDYNEKALKIIQSSIENRRYYEFYKRDVEIECVNVEFIIKISNEMFMKNLDGDTNKYYCPKPCFYNLQQANSYSHENFEINGQDEIGLVSKMVTTRPRKVQLQYMVHNDINYDKYKNHEELHIFHKYSYRKKQPNFFMSYQLLEPCKEFSFTGYIANDTADEYRVICFAASNYTSKEENSWKSEIYHDNHRCSINFSKWSLPGAGFSVYLTRGE